MNIGVVVIAHDGLQSILTGVGVVVNSFIEGFFEIKKECLALRDNNIHLICLAPYLQKESEDFNKEIRDITEKICKKNNGYLEEIKTLSDGSSQQSIWGDSRQWEEASKSAAKKIDVLQKNFDKLLVFSHDTIFSLVNKYSKKSEKVSHIWIPHSLGTVFKDKYSDEERISMEKKAVKEINDGKKNYLGYIGDFFKEVLIKDYSLAKEKCVRLTNNIYEKSNRFLIKKEDILRISKYNIPSNKKLIFSSGRCVYQKGFDVIIGASRIFLEKNNDYHLVLLMPSETSEKKYVEEINSKLSGIPNDKYTAVYKFDSKLPKYILKNKNLSMIIYASRFEGNPISPIEARCFCKSNVSLIYSNIDPLKKTLDNNPSAVSFNGRSNDLLKKMLQAKRGVKKIKFNRQNHKESIVQVYSSSINFLLE